MYIALMGCAQQGSAAPLAASVDSPSLIDVVDVIGPELSTPAVVTFTTSSGDLDATVVATGGSGSYTYTWTPVIVFDNSDTGSRFSIASSGTTNAARYNTLTINGARPPLATDAPFDATIAATCTVDDGVSTVDVVVGFVVQGITT